MAPNVACKKRRGESPQEFRPTEPAYLDTHGFFARKIPRYDFLHLVVWRFNCFYSYQFSDLAVQFVVRLNRLVLQI